LLADACQQLACQAEPTIRRNFYPVSARELMLGDPLTPICFSGLFDEFDPRFKIVTS
jgi:alkyl sulfatase BDS1-like metallo-beta-lactamase superfamily hydrolase